MPSPESIGLTHAGMNDGKAYELLCHDPKVKQYTKFGDKAYPASQETNTYTPIKKEKGQAYLDAADQLYSTAISKIRQPVESMNNWIQEKTGIEIASKVRVINLSEVYVIKLYEAYILGKILFSTALDSRCRKAF